MHHSASSYPPSKQDLHRQHELLNNTRGSRGPQRFSISPKWAPRFQHDKVQRLRSGSAAARDSLVRVEDLESAGAAARPADRSILQPQALLTQGAVVASFGAGRERWAGFDRVAHAGRGGCQQRSQGDDDFGACGPGSGCLQHGHRRVCVCFLATRLREGRCGERAAGKFKQKHTLLLITIDHSFSYLPGMLIASSSSPLH